MSCVDYIGLFNIVALLAWLVLLSCRFSQRSLSEKCSRYFVTSSNLNPIILWIKTLDKQNIEIWSLHPPTINSTIDKDILAKSWFYSSTLETNKSGTSTLMRRQQKHSLPSLFICTLLLFLLSRISFNHPSQYVNPPSTLSPLDLLAWMLDFG